MLETYLRWLLALLFVAPLAYWGSRLYVRLQQPWMPHGAGRDSARPRRKRLEVLDALPLGTGKMLWLVRADQSLFLIGAGDKDVRLVAPLPAEGGEEREEGRAVQTPGRD